MKKLSFLLCVVSYLFYCCTGNQISKQTKLSNVVTSYLDDNKIEYQSRIVEIREDSIECIDIDSKVFANDDDQQKLSEAIISLISTTLNSSEEQEESPYETMYKYSWTVDSVHCLLVNNLDHNLSFAGISIEILLSHGGAEDITEYETKTSDPGEALIRDLYEDYIFAEKDITDVADNFFTAKCRQKLIDAYDYELEPGEVAYGVWELRSGVQDFEDGDVAQSGVTDIQSIGNNDYIVRLSDMGNGRIIKITLAEEDGKWKIDDYSSRYREENNRALQEQGFK